MRSAISGYTGKMFSREPKTAAEFARQYYPPEYVVREDGDDFAEVVSAKTGRKIAFVDRSEMRGLRSAAEGGAKGT